MGLFDENREEELDGEALDAELAEAEARAQEVGYYRSLLQTDLFGTGGEDPIAARVQARVAQFIKGQMVAILRNEAPEAPASPLRAALEPFLQIPAEEVERLRELLQGLTAKEVVVLRTLVTRVADDPATAGSFLRPAVRAAAPPAKQVVRAPARPAPVVRKPVPVAKRPAPARLAGRPAEPPAPDPEGKGKSKIFSPTAAPFPVGNDLSAATEQKAASSATANNTLTRKALAHPVISDEHTVGGIDI